MYKVKITTGRAFWEGSKDGLPILTDTVSLTISADDLLTLAVTG